MIDLPRWVDLEVRGGGSPNLDRRFRAALHSQCSPCRFPPLAEQRPPAPTFVAVDESSLRKNSFA